MKKTTKSIILALMLALAGATTACQEKQDPEEVDVKVEAEYSEKDSVKTDPTEGKAEGDIGENMPPGTR